MRTGTSRSSDKSECSSVYCFMCGTLWKWCQ